MIGSKQSRQTLSILTGILLLGAVLRVIRLDFQPLWWDEGYSVWFAGHGVGEMIRLTAADIHPPLYYALLQGWRLFFGLSPISLRLFSVFVSLPAMPLAYLLGRDLENRKVGYLAAFIVAVSPFAIFYSQEIRMYGLAATFSLVTMWTGWRWAREGASRQWGIAYLISVLAGLYTLYMFALLPAAQLLWVLAARRHRVRAFLTTLAVALVAYLPWALYAGPKLLSYISYKVGKDHDLPLPLLTYFGKHLSAFTVGHLEGPLAAFWPWALLLLIPLLAAGAQALSRQRKQPLLASPVAYLTTLLLIALSLGFIQQLRAPFIPDRFERVLLFAAPALWLLIALGLWELWRSARLLAELSLAALLIAMAASLISFYTTPRYAQRDYRPLITTMQRQMRPGDSIFAVFPWQIGYFWAYLPSDQHSRVHLSPDPDWSDAVQHKLDALLASGGVWFPEHLALGGIFEQKVESYLGHNTYQVRNSWLGDETRLTGWDRPHSGAEAIHLLTPQDWTPGITLARASLQQDAYRLFLDLDWQGADPAPSQLAYTVTLQGPDKKRWAKRDVSPFAQPWPDLDVQITPPWQNSDRVAITLPAGAPPGDYDLRLSLLDSQRNVIGSDVSLGTITLDAPASDVAPWPQHHIQVHGEAIDFLGYDLQEGVHRPGDALHVTLFWQTHGALTPAHNLFLQLLDSKGRVVAGYDAPPIVWLPTTAWDFEAPLRTQHELPLPAQLSPGAYTMIAGLYNPQNGARVHWGQHDALVLGKVVIAERPHSYQMPHPQHLLDLTLLGGHTLLGYDFSDPVQPGAPLTVTLYWRAAGPLSSRYRVFVHLLDDHDTILIQDDAEPDRGQHPTTSWLPGEYISDSHPLTLPDDRPVRGYSLEIGLYEPQTGQRLPFIDDRGVILSDHITVPLP